MSRSRSLRKPKSGGEDGSGSPTSPKADIAALARSNSKYKSAVVSSRF